MKDKLDKVKAACESRGDFPGCCKGCVANYGEDQFINVHSNTVYARCKLGFPRSWNTVAIAQDICGLLNNKED